MENSIVLGVDIGGSHITAALVDLKTKKIVKGTKVREQVYSKGSAGEILNSWCNVIEASFKNHNLEEKRVGIAMPGPFNYEEGISLMQHQDKYDALYELNIKKLLSEILHIESYNFKFLNDAECFLKGEVFSGAAKNANKAIGLTLGTGLGSSVYDNGEVRDANLWCSPFLESIAEEYLSTRWFIKRYAALTGKQVKDVKEIVEKQLSDGSKEKVFSEFGKNLALFLNNAMAQDQPDAIILGGNISNAYELFGNELNGNLSSSFSQTMISKTSLGEDAVLLGAASAWQAVKVPAI